MKNRANFSLHPFTDTNITSEAIALVRKVLLSPDNDMPVEDMMNMLNDHHIEHGVSIGYLHNQDGELIAVAGLHYLADASQYELICETLYGFDSIRTDAVNFMIAHAFYNLGMDKICARTSDDDMGVLKNAGFAYFGERAFVQDGRSHIWNYFEIENESYASATILGQYFHGSPVWDNRFLDN